MGRRLGLLIGINQYQDSNFQPLRYAETDARAIAHWLVNSRGGRWHPSDVQLFLGPQATRHCIEQRLMQLCLQTAGPDDTLFVYFAGHAFLDEGRAEGYLALADTFYHQPASGLQLASTLLQIFGRSPARAVVCVLDCFQTGSLWRQRRVSPFDCRPLPGSTLLATLQQLPNRFLLCSCRGNEFAAEQGEQNVGLLAHRLLLGLCGGAADPASGQITFQRLSLYLQQSLGEQQRPQLFGQGLGPVVLVGEEVPTEASPSAAAATAGGSGQSGLYRMPTGPAPAMQQAGNQTGQWPQLTQAPAGLAQLSPQQPATPAAMPAAEQQAALLLQQARSLLQQQRPTDALNYVERALQLTPTQASALLLKGQLLGAAGRFAEALQAIEQVLHQEPSNALAWSTRAALLANMGQFEEALRAIERSLALDPHNSETQTIKSAILVKMAVAQTPAAPPSATVPGTNSGQTSPTVGGTATSAGQARVGSRQGASRPGRALLVSLMLQIVGLGLGLLGAWLAIKHPGLPSALPLTIEGLGLALLCVNALSGCYFDGLWRFLPIPLTSLLTGAVPVYLLLTQSGRARLAGLVEANPRGFTAISFILLWFGLVAVLPFLLALVGLVSGWLRGARRR
ncbi:tetratricopeptide repeat protein [Thermogemmatispora sp.]|uniref:tetratricopeptide repeat protein n=1 Tax=Thermogemmatispora sp. TaxID=1968838 RepID=UPI002ACC2044|nr:tetratricopeptide repeat protein [Thermogemmatispora sp.]